MAIPPAGRARDTFVLFLPKFRPLPCGFGGAILCATEQGLRSRARMLQWLASAATCQRQRAGAGTGRSGGAHSAGACGAQASGKRQCSWGACIDVSAACLADTPARGARDAEASEFRDGELVVDDCGLQLAVSGAGADAGKAGGLYASILARAQHASSLSRETSDALSSASTHESDAADAETRERVFLASDGDVRVAKQSESVRLSGLCVKSLRRMYAKHQPATPATPETTRSTATIARDGASPGARVAWADGERGLPTLPSPPQSPLPAKRKEAPPCDGSAFQIECSALGSGRGEIALVHVCKRHVIGKGAHSQVWRCVDSRRGGSALAVKEVPLGCDKEQQQRAAREAVTMYGVDHVNIVRCHNVLYAGNTLHLVMELMDGGSLRDAMERCHARRRGGARGVIPAEALARIAEGVLCALQFLHDDLEVMHRDVKPGNILLSSSGCAKLGDLGIVTLPGVGLVDPCKTGGAEGDGDVEMLEGGTTPAVEWIGTMTYMSPERLAGECYSFSSDIWAAGLVLLEAAIGRYPFLEAGSERGPGGAGQGGGGKRTSIQFWDLLYLVTHGPCPSRLLAEGDWRQLQPLVAACLTKDALKRPCARDILGGGGGRGFLDEACPISLGSWVRESLCVCAVCGGEGGGSSLSDDGVCMCSSWAKHPMIRPHGLAGARVLEGGYLADEDVGGECWATGGSENDALQQGLVDVEGSEADGWL